MDRVLAYLPDFSSILGVGKAPDAVEGCLNDYKVWAAPRRAVEVLDLPGSFNLKSDQPFGFGLDQWMLDDCVDAATAWALFQRVAQFGEAFGIAGGHHLDVTIFGVADPTLEFELAGFTMHKPAKAYALYPSAY